MTTKIPAELSSTPGIVDNSNATALTINSSENAKFEGLVGINKDINASVALSVGADATSTTSYGLEVTNSTAATRFLVNGEGSSIFYKTDNAEGMRFNASTGGLTFGGDTAAANTLDDYEEGTFTVSVTADSGTPSVGSVEDTVSYTKIGNKVFINGQIGGVNTSGCSGDLKITMPFAGAASSERSDFYFGMIATNTTSVSYFKLINTTNTNTFIVDTKKPDGTVDGSTAAFMASAGSFDLDLSGIHFTTT